MEFQQEKEQLSAFLHWLELPENLLYHIFFHLTPGELLCASEVCSRWNRIACDELLWRHLVLTTWQLDHSSLHAHPVPSWRQLYKKYYYHSPCVEAEEVKVNQDEVWNVSFSHDGRMFATGSKDGTVHVWEEGLTMKQLYTADICQVMEDIIYVQRSQFSPSDIRLLVSWRYPTHIRGGISVFALTEGFPLLAILENMPSQLFGAWFTDNYIITGELDYDIDTEDCTSIIRISRVPDEYTPTKLLKTKDIFHFHGTPEGRLMQKLMLEYAPCSSKTEGDASPTLNVTITPEASISENLDELYINTQPSTSKYDTESDGRTSASVGDDTQSNCCLLDKIPSGVMDCVRTIDVDNADEKLSQENFDIESGQAKSIPCRAKCDKNSEKSWNKINQMGEQPRNLLLVFRTTSLDCLNDTVCIKSLRTDEVMRRMNSKEELSEHDTVDYNFNMKGFVTDVSFSPCHRYLYINCRALVPRTPNDNDLNNGPEIRSTIKKEFDIHVIDVQGMRNLGIMSASHKSKAQSGCGLIYLDVARDWLASGAEDKRGYLWDRTYNTFIGYLQHDDVVNSVAFKPCDQETLISVSDDKTIKVWKSRNRLNQQVMGRGSTG